MALVVGCGKKEKPADDVQDNQPSFEYEENVIESETEENLSASTKVSNAILSKTEIWIGSVTEDNCMITISYPNVVNALIQADASLAEEATDAEIDAIWSFFISSKSHL